MITVFTEFDEVQYNKQPNMNKFIVVQVEREIPNNTNTHVLYPLVQVNTYMYNPKMFVTQSLRYNPEIWGILFSSWIFC